MTSIAVNACRGRLRRRKVRLALLKVLEPLQAMLHHPAVEDAVIQREADRRLWQAVDALDEKHRLPVVLRYVHELSAAEIAEVIRDQ